MLAVVGTVPQTDFPLAVGPVALRGDHLLLEGVAARVNRGTPALLAAAGVTAAALAQPPPVAYLSGDIGVGDGSRSLYRYLVENLGATAFSTLAFHYLQPDVDWHNQVFFAIEALAARPCLIADAGYMYVAKMSGMAGEYDLFTPDVGELAFLADETAPHPFYTRGFILHADNQVLDLIARAYTHDNASRYLLVKGRTDYLASREGILETVAEPAAAALEAIGGTGDTLTGIVCALIEAGYDLPTAAVTAARVNRLAGVLAQPTPATQVLEIIRCIPPALEQVVPELPVRVC